MRDRRKAEDAFDDFYRTTASRVVHLVYATTGDLTVAQDATQEAYARAWRDWDRVSGHDDALAWVRTVARRIAISEWRRGESRGRAHARHGLVQTQPPPNEDRAVVVAALRTLSPPLRETLALHYLADRSIDQIAAELDVPPGTVKARLHRGRNQLAQLLRGPDRPPESTPVMRPASTSRKENRHG
ncbi:RNA polymerase sigma factor [Knoellia remsis]|uniref:RNA polymerase sigma factor n=1 Tax=Knoellia remsis TaxID=407159 RepID=UPI001FE3DF73|nr:sigma-70 family RNA polymerase sigma factor [Knoellia remsis]